MISAALLLNEILMEASGAFWRFPKLVFRAARGMFSDSPTATLSNSGGQSGAEKPADWVQFFLLPTAKMGRES